MTTQKNDSPSTIIVSNIADNINASDIQQKLFLARLSGLSELRFESEALSKIPRLSPLDTLIDPQVSLAAAGQTLPLSVISGGVHLVLDDSNQSDAPLQQLFRTTEFQSIVKKLNQLLAKDFILFVSQLPAVIDFTQNTLQPIKISFPDNQQDILQVSQQEVWFDRARLLTMLELDNPVKSQQLAYIVMLMFAKLLGLSSLDLRGLAVVDYFHLIVDLDRQGNPRGSHYEIQPEKMLSKAALSLIVQRVSESYYALRAREQQTLRYYGNEERRYFAEHEVRFVKMTMPDESFYFDHAGNRFGSYEFWNYEAEGFELAEQTVNGETLTFFLDQRIEEKIESHFVDVQVYYEGVVHAKGPDNQLLHVEIRKKYQRNAVTGQEVPNSLSYESDSALLTLTDDGKVQLTEPTVPYVEGYEVADIAFNKSPVALPETGALTLNIAVRYQAEEREVVLLYIDDEADGAVVSGERLTGRAYETYTFRVKVPENYELVDPEPTRTITFSVSADEQQKFLVHLWQKHEITEHETQATVHIFGLPETDETHAYEVKRVFPYTEDKNLVTGKVEKYAENTGWYYEPPVVKGYELTNSLVSIEQDFSVIDFRPINHDLYYKRIEIRVPVRLIDLDAVDEDSIVNVSADARAALEQEKAKLQRPSLVGHDGDLIVFDAFPENYEIVSSNLPEITHFDSEMDQEIVIELRHKHARTEKQATVTVSVSGLPEEILEQAEQTTVFDYIEDIDHVTGEVTYEYENSVWLFEAPIVKDYMLENEEEMAVLRYDFRENDFESISYALSYVRSNIVIPVHYIDIDEENGNRLIETRQLVGREGDKVKSSFKIALPENYILLSNDFDEDMIFDSHEAQEIFVSCGHATDARTFDSELRVVYQGMTEDLRPADNLQVVHVEALTDRVTDLVSYRALNDFEETIFSPKVKGYQLENIDEQEVTFELSEDLSTQIIRVNYEPIHTELEIVYRDEDNDGAIVNTDFVILTPDNAADYVFVPNVPHNYLLVLEDSANADLSGSTRNETITVKLIHDKNTVRSTAAFTVQTEGLPEEQIFSKDFIFERHIDLVTGEVEYVVDEHDATYYAPTLDNYELVEKQFAIIHYDLKKNNFQSESYILHYKEK